MDLDQDICLCFHVSLRKVKNFIRLEKPVRASQISQCYGAGTGCGWCRPFLEKLLHASQTPIVAAPPTEPAQPDPASEPVRPGPPTLDAAHGEADELLDTAQPLESLSAQAYAHLRKTYVDSGRGTPP